MSRKSIGGLPDPAVDCAHFVVKGLMYKRRSPFDRAGSIPWIWKATIHVFGKAEQQHHHQVITNLLLTMPMIRFEISAAAQNHNQLKSGTERCLVEVLTSFWRRNRA
jgi:hypothetical protein